MRELSREEFLEYLNAEKIYNEMVEDHRRKIHYAYLDIAPTMVATNIDTGLVYKLGCRVEEYAISLVELREALELQRKKSIYETADLSKSIKNIRTRSD